MITLALDTSTERCTLALTTGSQTAHREIDGPRRHAREVLGLIDEALREVGAGPTDISKILTGDGPGSFTGLRVATAVAKSLTWNRPAVQWETTPSLLIRAVSAAGDGPMVVLALADALRGELYAGCWRFDDHSVIAIGEAPHARVPESLDRFGSLDTVVGTVPDRLVDQVRKATGLVPVTTLPDARDLLKLCSMAGGTVPVADPAAWHPSYGRPAEAQAVWERKHGRPLPDSTHRSI